jgi:hypothetical protein
VEARQNHPQWGWKEPRTTLLLEFWKSLLPQMKILVVYRHYTQVVNSMLRRKLSHPRIIRRLKNTILLLPRKKYVQQYLLSWERYNREILTFAGTFPEDTAVIRVDDLISCSLDLANFLSNRWGFILRPVPAEAVFKSGLLKTTSPSFYNSVDATILSQCEATYLELGFWRQQTLNLMTQNKNQPS